MRFFLFVSEISVALQWPREHSVASFLKPNLLKNITIDSAGTIGYHAGSPPDPRAIETSRRNGVNISAQRSRKVRDGDFTDFDYILAMDLDNYRDLMDRCPPELQSRISMFLSHAANLPLDEMPDPYYGHGNEFETCFSAAVDAAKGLLAAIQKEHF